MTAFIPLLCYQTSPGCRGNASGRATAMWGLGSVPGLEGHLGKASPLRALAWRLVVQQSPHGVSCEESDTTGDFHFCLPNLNCGLCLQGSCPASEKDQV